MKCLLMLLVDSLSRCSSDLHKTFLLILQKCSILCMNSVLLFKARLKSRKIERSCFTASVNRSEYLVH